jgi:hypothetical protein
MGPLDRVPSHDIAEPSDLPVSGIPEFDFRTLVILSPRHCVVGGGHLEGLRFFEITAQVHIDDYGQAQVP